jgi:hypothetical protein
MRNSGAWLLLSGAVLSGACNVDWVDGSGNVITQTRPVSGFSAVSLSGSTELVVEQTGTESLTITTDDNLLPYIRTEVTGNTLEIGVNQPMTNLRPTNGIVVRMTVKQLDGLNISGSGQVDARGVTADRLEVDISGSGEVQLRGSANDLDLRISGSGSYQGEELKSKRADVRISGSADAVIAVEEALNAQVSGSGSIEYVGDPQVTEQVSGSGSVHKR